MATIVARESFVENSDYHQETVAAGIDLIPVTFGKRVSLVSKSIPDCHIAVGSPMSEQSQEMIWHYEKNRG